jgi:NADH:quinone reductase (non-electrogenic)
VMANAAARQCLDLEASKADFAELYEVIKGENAKRMFNEGDVDAGILACGQGVGMAHDVPTVKELFDRMISEAKQAISRLA